MAPSEPPAASVAVVIASRDRPESLAGALEAVLAVVPGGVEVLVVDSASTDRRTEEVAREAGVRFVRSERPGLSVARNIAVGHLDVDVAVFTDDDCRPRPGWVEALTTPFCDPEVGFTTGTLRGADGGTAADVAGLGAQRWRWPDDPLRMGSGANMAVRRRAVLDVAGFDERLGAGAPIPSAEEHDVFLRMLRSGWIGGHAPDAVVDHHDRRSRWQTLRMFRAYGLGSGALCALARDIEPSVARAMVRRRLWDDGVRAMLTDLRRGWEEPAARRLFYVAGAVAGLLRGSRLAPRPLPVVDATTTYVVHLADQRRSRTDSHGIINFSLGLVRSLPAHLRVDERLVVLANPEIDRELDRTAFRRQDEVRLLAAPRSVAHRLWVDHVAVRRAARAAGADVVLYPKGFLPLAGTDRGSRQVVCLHDDIPHRQLHDAQESVRRRLRAAYFTLQIRWSLRRADRRLFVSSFTEGRLQALGGGTRPGDTVSFEGISLPRVPATPVADKVGRALLLGSPLRHKNTMTGLALARAEPTLVETLDHVLVVGWCDRSDDSPGHLPVRHRPEPLSNEQLAELIAASRLLVYPSTYEGFGLPPVEAFALGTPAVYATTAASREVLGGFPGSFEMGDDGSFRHAVAEVMALTDEDLVRLAEQMWRRYSWTTVAGRFADALRTEAADRAG